MLRATSLQTRRGAIAVKFAMLSFGFFAIAATVIDMRFASIAQQQMQVATESAALEGMRQRNTGGAAFARQSAINRLEWMFDDDLNPANGDALNYGAGPVINLINGRASDKAYSLIDIPASPVYKPQLQFNLANLVHGDIVSGQFDLTDTQHVEFSDYTRTDFTASPISNFGTEDAYLVRLRRTNDDFGLDNLPGVSTFGPTLPLLFGRGSVIRHEDAGYSVRRDGFTVRATSIAATRRAIEISGPGPSFGELPLQRFSLESPGDGTRWDAFNFFTPTVLRQNNTERIVLVSGPGTPGEIWGFHAKVQFTSDDIVHRVGQRPTSIQPPNTPYAGLSLVPIHRNIGGVDRTIGFAMIIVDQIVTNPQLRFRIRYFEPDVLATGASALSLDGLADLATIPGLAAAHADFNHSVLAPVITR